MPVRTRSGLEFEYGGRGPEWMRSLDEDTSVTPSRQTNEDETKEDSSISEPQLTTEFAIPIYQAIRPPSLADTTREACYKFGMDYRRYKANVEQRNASSNAKIHLITIKECIQERIFQRLWRYGMRLKHEEDATEERVATWIKTKAKVTDTSNLLEIERNLKKSIQMDSSIMNMEDRLETLLGNFTDYLADNGVCELYLEDSQKQAIKLLQTLLEPKVFKDQVRKDLEMKSKSLREDWHTFVTYLLDKGKDMDKVRTCFSQDNDTKGTMKNNQNQKKKKQGSSDFKKLNQDQTSGKEKKFSNAQKKEPPNCLNPSCKEKHLLKYCSNTSAEKKQELIEQWRKRKEEDKKTSGKLKKMTIPNHNNEGFTITLEKEIVIPVALDNGADVTVMSINHLKQLEATGAFICIKTLPEVLIFNTASEVSVHAEKECRINMELNTFTGSITIKKAQVYIINEDIPEMLFGKPLLNLLGIDISNLIGDIAKQNPGKEFDGTEVIKTFPQRNHLYKLQLNDKEVTISDTSPILHTTPLSKDDLFYQEPHGYTDIVIGNDSNDEIHEALLELSKNASLDYENQEKLYTLFMEYQSVFRTKLGKDPPALVEPRRLIMQDGAKPRRCTARKYPEAQRLFMETECQLLEQNEMIYENDKSLWCSNALVVPKGKGFRLVNDARVTNSQIMHTQWPMPILEVCLTHLSKKTYFSTIDLFKGYWQFPLHPDSQEYFSFMTHNKVYTPTRLVQGDTGAVEYFQRQMMKVFEPLLYTQLLIWLDDLLLYATTIEEMFDAITALFKLCIKFNLKLNAKKCHFFQDSIKWCGRIIDKHGIKQDPERIIALSSIPTPTTAQQLQQFVCACNWMRVSLPNFTEVIAPLRQILEVAYQTVGKRTSAAVKNVKLEALGWTTIHDTAFQSVISLLKTSVTLAHPNPEYAFCVFTDASLDFWSAVITQIPHDDLNLPFEDQNHEPLAFISGAFKNAASRWAIVEKEAFPIVEVCSKYAWLLLQPHGFHLFTDHRNLIYIFDPLGSRPTLPKHIADRLSRWALHLLGFRYTIHHITGEDNVWSDLLSRWGAPVPKKPSLKLIYALPQGLSPLQHEDFIWPTSIEILTIQTSYKQSFPLEGEAPNLEQKLEWNNEKQLWMYEEKIWIPNSAKELKIRLMVIAHSGTSGHRGIQITIKALKEQFYWKTITTDVEAFIKECLHCLSTTGGQKIPRPYGEQLHASKPGEIIHFDFLFIRPKSTESTLQYILIIKDDASGFCELIPSESPTTETTVTALLGWFKRYGITKLWISDQGTHFKNQLMCDLRRLLGADHHFVTAGVPWANGTIERVNVEVLRIIRALISEFKLSHLEWFKLLPLIQHIINATPSQRLGNHSPMEVFLGRKPPHLLSAIFPLSIKTIDDIKIIHDERIKNVNALLKSMDEMHKKVEYSQRKTREQNRQKRLKDKAVKEMNFQEGDFVLHACSEDYAGAKLLVRWQGPYKIIKCKNQWIFLIEDLNTGSIKEVHYSRLKFYHDKSLNVSEELKQQVAHNQQGYEVKTFLDHRQNRISKEWELLTVWKGFSHQEATWESLQTLFDDLPEKVRKYVEKLIPGKIQNILRTELEHFLSGREV